MAMPTTDPTSTTRVRTGRRPRWAYLLPALLLLAASLLVACAGDDESSAPQTDSDGVTSGDSGSTESKGEDGVSVAPGAPAPGVEGGATGGGSVNLPSTLNRTIIRTGSVELTVDSVAESFDQVRNLAEAAGGFVAESSFRGSDEDQSATLRLRVPAGEFGNIIASLEDLAVEVRSATSSSQDVTEEFTDLESSLRNLRAVEQQYLTLLGQAREINDILLVQDRLIWVRNDIEQIEGRLKLLGNLADLATINVSLYPVTAEADDSGDGFGDQIADAWDSSLETLAAVGTGIAVVLVWSWWLIPVLLVLAFVARRYSVRQRALDRVRGDAAVGQRVDTPESDT